MSKTLNRAHAEWKIENVPLSTKNPSDKNDSDTAGQSTANSIYFIDRILISLVIISFLLTVLAQAHILLNG
ncbi:MAG: hypothetical protein ABFD18_07530 [Syntrophomonas sp.]